MVLPLHMILVLTGTQIWVGARVVGHRTCSEEPQPRSCSFAFHLSIETPQMAPCNWGSLCKSAPAEGATILNWIKWYSYPNSRRLFIYLSLFNKCKWILSLSWLFISVVAHFPNIFFPGLTFKKARRQSMPWWKIFAQTGCRQTQG